MSYNSSCFLWMPHLRFFPFSLHALFASYHFIAGVFEQLRPFCTDPPEGATDHISHLHLLSLTDTIKLQPQNTYYLDGNGGPAETPKTHLLCPPPLLLILDHARPGCPQRVAFCYCSQTFLVIMRSSISTPLTS